MAKEKGDVEVYDLVFRWCFFRMKTKGIVISVKIPSSVTLDGNSGMTSVPWIVTICMLWLYVKYRYVKFSSSNSV